MEHSSKLAEDLAFSQSMVPYSHFEHYQRSQSLLFPEVSPESYAFHSTPTDLEIYECKPVVETYGVGGERGQLVVDNFQGGGYLGNSSERMGLGMHIHFNSQLDVKPMSLVAPDEISCISAGNRYGCHSQYGTKNSRVALASSSAQRTNKNRKKPHVVKGQWTVEEDRLLVRLVEQLGVKKWSHIAQMLPGRIGKQCRERWHNHLRPDIKKDIWSEEEDKILIQAHREIGNKWAKIAKRLPGRTENSIKNHWNATKRRQYSKRKCRTKHPRGTLLQDYIEGLNLGGPRKTPSRSSKGEKPSHEPDSIVADDRLVPDYEFDDEVLHVPELPFEEELFQLDSFLAMDVTSEEEKMEVERMVNDLVDVDLVEEEEEEGRPTGEVDLMELISQVNSNR